MAKTRIGYVYFIQAVSEERLIKIGWTVGHPDNRLWQLRMMSPVRLLPIGVVRTHFRRTESDLHLRFGEYRQHGEWFSPGEKLMEFIRRKARRWPAPGANGIVEEPSPERMRKAYERQLNEMVEWAASTDGLRQRVRARQRQMAANPQWLSPI